MKTITDIKPQVKTPTRQNIYLDGSFYCGLELDTVLKHRLKIGQNISTEELDKIQLESETIHATDRALNYIARVKKTKKQVFDYLLKKGYTKATADEVIKKLVGYRYIDDFSYAQDYVRIYSEKKGKRLLKMELFKKGISEKDIEKALSELESETENASKVAEKYLRHKEINKENVLKCYKYLLSKGFDYDTAKSAVEELRNYEDDNF